MHEGHDHFAVCWETIFLNISSAAGAVVVTVEGVPNENGALLMVDVDDDVNPVVVD